MLEVDSGYVPEEENLFLGFGTKSLIHYMGCSLYKEGDVIGLDTPFYYCFTWDLKKSGISFAFRDIT